MLAREFARESVEVSHPLHRDEKRLVGGEPGVGQDRHLLAQVILEFRDVDGMDRLTATQEASPLVDLLLEDGSGVRGRDAQAPCGAGVTGPESARQMPRSVSSTASHCRCSSASRARPWSVIA